MEDSLNTAILVALGGAKETELIKEHLDELAFLAETVRDLKQSGFAARFQILGPMDPEHKRGIKVETVRQWIDTNVIEYLGTTTDVKSFIENADCVVLPSYREGTP